MPNKLQFRRAILRTVFARIERPHFYETPSALGMEARKDAADPSIPASAPAAAPLLLLKTRSQPHDPYATHFAPPAFAPIFLPVLTHTPSAAACRALLSLLRSSPPFSAYGGLVVTSQRTVEVLADAIRDAAAAGAPGWAESRKVVYVVGPATGDAVARAIEGYFPRWHVEGRDAGNGEALAQHIAQNYDSPAHDRAPGGHEDLPTEIERGRMEDEAQARRAPLLFLAGEKRRDTVPAALMARSVRPDRRVRVDELACYGTEDRPDFPEKFARAVRELGASSRPPGTPAWVVVFSPAHCGSVLRALGWENRGAATEKSRQEAGIRVASIGPTTRDFLKEKWGFDVDVCAPMPSPEGVRKGIEDWLEQRKEEATSSGCTEREAQCR